MTSSPIKLGLIGIGGYGHVHLRTARTLESSGHCKIVAVADPAADRLPEAVAALKDAGVDVLDDPMKVLDRREIDAVVISSPIQFHASQSIDALRAGKHVYLEKPPCATLGEWAQIADAKNSAGKVCAIGFQMQTMPGARHVKRQLIDREFGEIKAIWSSVCSRREHGYYERRWAGKMTFDGLPVFDGPATNALSHVVHMSAFLAGPEEQAWAKIARVRGAMLRARSAIESYDVNYIDAETTAGIPIRLAFSHAGERSDLPYVRVRCATCTISLTWDGHVTYAPADGSAPARVAHYDFDSSAASLIDFLTAVRDPEDHGGVATRVEDTLAYLQLVNGALQSSGGVKPFEPDQVERIDEGVPQNYYRVRGLDDAFAAFASDPDAIPQAFQSRPMSWITAADIKPRLAV